MVLESKKRMITTNKKYYQYNPMAGSALGLAVTHGHPYVWSD
jgi:hypothetical protein